MFEQLITKFLFPKNRNGNPDKSGGDKKPVTNRDENITNREEQEKVEDVEEQSIGGKNEPEIDHPSTEPEKTEKKIPLMDQNKDDDKDES